MGRRISLPDTDQGWASERRTALGAAGLLLAAILTVDAGAGLLTPARAALWAGLAALAFVILLPSRVSAGPGRLAVRGLLTERQVRTDALVSVRWMDGVAQRMVLRDADGHRVEIDPEVFVRNPAMWRRVDEDTRGCVERGTLLCGATAMRQLAARIDRRTARSVFQVSGLG
ncbi:hypothetical protein [Streptomyces sp. NPDC090022]|uniref:hypothetical protein n=1 Tax=Streptomyces sp. NPDC090022 TaxID=3365920 RepID=UPI00381CB5F2